MRSRASLEPSKKLLNSVRWASTMEPGSLMREFPLASYYRQLKTKYRQLALLRSQGPVLLACLHSILALQYLKLPRRPLVADSVSWVVYQVEYHESGGEVQWSLLKHPGHFVARFASIQAQAVWQGHGLHLD